MNETAALLNFIYQNSAMGITTLEQIIGITKDEAFRRHLSLELEGYVSIHARAKKLLNQNGFDEEGLGTLEKLRTYLMISVQTLTDQSTSHIAEMLITGSNMGILDATKNLKKYPQAEQDIRALMEHLQRFEEDNVQRLKTFL